MMTGLVQSVGFNDRKYPAKLKGKNLAEYDFWKGFLRRCYCPKYQRKQPTYGGCSVSDNFKSYSYFYEWCQSQVGFGQKGFELDKDLLLKGNKIYSEDTCLFLPSELNLLLISSKASRGNLPLGVTIYRGKFLAQCSTGQSSQRIGIFETLELAFHAYKQVKEAFIKAQAEKWKALIDPRAYAALIAYEVLITD